MHDFTSMEEVHMFTVLGPMGPASEYLFHPTDLFKIWQAIRSIGGEMNIFSDKRFINTFGPDAKAPGGGDVAYSIPLRKGETK